MFNRCMKISGMGSGDRWEPICRKNLGSKLIKDSTDLSASYITNWDEDNLYFIFRVVDDIKFDVRAFKYEQDFRRPCNFDCIELFLDMNNDKAENFDAQHKNCRFEFVYGRDTVTGVFKSNAGVAYKWADTKNGYIIRARIPWKTLEIQPKANYRFGCEICVNDNDNDARDGVFNTFGRKILAWSQEGVESTAYKDTSVYGTIELVDR